MQVCIKLYSYNLLKEKECEECDQGVKAWTTLKNHLETNHEYWVGLFDWFVVMGVTTNLATGLYEASQRCET